jgi:phosphoribosylamine--glycine ligase
LLRAAFASRSAIEMTAARKVLVVGSGAREHALAVRLLESPSVSDVIVAPGNAGTASAPVRLAGKTLRNASAPPMDVARAERVDLVVVGPEGPLCDGLVDALAALGIPTYGPTRAAARLEGSKAFMKEFAVRHGVPTARHVVVRDVTALEQALGEFSTAPVVKADGLCAGKGVTVAASHDEARRVAEGMLSGQLFGAAGRSVVLEDRLEGSEASIHALSDGQRFVVLPVSQDHKRIGEGDRGPNTGGMGAYAPAPLVTPALAERIERTIVRPVIDGMRSEGAPFVGTLYAGLMISPAGDPHLIEINVRFGDPETQVLMNVLDGDLGEALLAAARGSLDPSLLRVSSDSAMCVVLAAHGYPGDPRKGDAITGIDRAEALDGVRVYHAGTRVDSGSVVTSGGRVLGVTARAGTLAEARDRVYAAVEHVRFEGRQYRRDIGARALGAA